MKIEQTLHGQRITIRNCCSADLHFLTQMWFDEENGKYLSDPTADYVDTEFRAALDALPDSPMGYYLLLELPDGCPVGSFCMFPEDNGRSYDIGYCIHRSYWRHGYAAEALTLLLGWLREHGAERVTAEVAVENLASTSLLRKFGFTLQRQSRFQKYHMEIHYDSCIYAKTLP